MISFLIENTGSQLLPQRNKICLLCFMYTQANKHVHSKILSEEMLVHYTENPYKLASRYRRKNYQTISELSHKHRNIPDISRWDKFILTRQTLDKLVKEISSNN